MTQPSSPSRSGIHRRHRVHPFRPAPWLPGPHLQTVGGKLLRPRPELDTVRERLSTPDGDFVDLDLMPDPAPGAPVVLVLHGLEGSSGRGYMRLALHHLSRRGLRGVALNFRSCSGEPNRTARFYHSGDTEDVALALAHLRDRFAGRRFGALGFSLGGNVLLKLLGEWGAEAHGRLDAGVAVSVPYDLAAGARRLERTRWGRLYTRYFMRSLLRKTRGKADLLDGRVALPRVLASRTVREFDDALTAPLHGFRDAAHYYTESSSAHYLVDVRVPTLLVHALDDPFLPSDALPRDTIRANPHLRPAFVRRGGHVGFVHGAPWAPRFWAEETAAGFLASSLLG